jgi:integrase
VIWAPALFAFRRKPIQGIAHNFVDRSVDMARGIHRLNPVRVRNAKPGMHADGGGLYLRVTRGGRGLTRSWVFRFKGRYMGLGSVDTWSLAQARQRAQEARQQLDSGIDPIEHRRRQRAHKAAAAPFRSFEDVAEEYLRAFEGSWKSARHWEQWRQSLDDYIIPVLGELDIAAIDTDAVMRVLAPIWPAMPETASRVRGRIERILAFAGIDPNPARWRGHLQYRLAARNKARDVKHLAALDWREMPAFMAGLRELDGAPAAALTFTVLTACRIGEVLGAAWSEIDFTARTWTIPKVRMKRDREHRVPLSDAALGVLERMSAIRHKDRVFPTSAQAVRLALLRLRAGVTIHGFRSSFRDWASENSSVPDRVVEAALAHVIGDQTEAAYRRGDLFERRRELMQAWALYLSGPESNVVALRASQ